MWNFTNALLYRSFILKSEVEYLALISQTLVVGYMTCIPLDFETMISKVNHILNEHFVLIIMFHVKKNVPSCIRVSHISLRMLGGGGVVIIWVIPVVKCWWYTPTPGLHQCQLKLSSDLTSCQWNFTVTCTS